MPGRVRQSNRPGGRQLQFIPARRFRVSPTVPQGPADAGRALNSPGRAEPAACVPGPGPGAAASDS